LPICCFFQVSIQIGFGHSTKVLAILSALFFVKGTKKCANSRKGRNEFGHGAFHQSKAQKFRQEISSSIPLKFIQQWKQIHVPHPHFFYSISILFHGPILGSILRAQIPSTAKFYGPLSLSTISYRLPPDVI
jgi:hypothetical protein